MKKGEKMSTSTPSEGHMKKGKKMATEWKTPIEKVPSVFSEKELLTMSFEEYWAQGLRELHPEMEIKGGHLESPAHIWWMKELKRLAPQTVRSK